MKIGYRTLKTGIGAALALSIAQWFDLTFYGSAAIITILCISKTKKSSLRVSWQRFVSCLIGLVCSVIFFEVFGYHALAFGLLLLVFIPIAVKARAKEGIATSAVIIVHVYSFGGVTTALIINEVILIIIGIGVALVMNLYMPSVEKELEAYRIKIESNFKTIFNELAVYLRHGESNWSGSELTNTLDLLQKAKDIALYNVENHLLRYEDHYYHYFTMREKQFELIERMLPYISSIDAKIEHGEKMASFFENISEAVSPINTSAQFLKQLSELREMFRCSELPQSRQEFEIRSALLFVMNDMNEYLLIKDALSTNVTE